MTMVRLSDLRIARETWPRLGLDESRVQLFAELIREGNDPPPIEIVARDDGTYWVADGVHRCHAAGEAAKDEIEANLVIPIDDESPAQCAFRRALETSTHGALQLTRSERRAATIRLLCGGPDLSHRSVARLVGVAHSSVDRWAEEMAESATSPEDDPPAVRLPTADETARRLVGFLTKIEASRGLLDYLASSRMGRHLADAFEHHMGDDALTHARKFANCASMAVQVLETRR